MAAFQKSRRTENQIADVPLRQTKTPLTVGVYEVGGEWRLLVSRSVVVRFGLFECLIGFRLAGVGSPDHHDPPAMSFPRATGERSVKGQL